jgi:uncharacterized protein (DUF952 family)
MTNQPVFKVLTDQEWDRFQDQKIFKGSPLDIKDGFIHLSKKIQVRPVIDRYFQELFPLIILKISNQLILEKLKWELSPSINQKFPHLYEALSLEDIDTVYEIKTQNDLSDIF